MVVEEMTEELLDTFRKVDGRCEISGNIVENGQDIMMDCGFQTWAEITSGVCESVR